VAASLRQLLEGALRRPSLRGVAVVFVGLGGLVGMPLLRQPGYELATALGIALAFLGGLPAWAVVASARRSPREVRFSTLLLATLLLTLALPLPALLAAVVASLLTTPCNPLANIGFCVLLLPSCACLAAALGMLLALTTTRFARFVRRSLFVVLVSAAVTAWPILTGPQVFAFNLFAGYFPGPLYDESLHLTEALYWARTEAALWTLLALCIARGAYVAAGKRLAFGPQTRLLPATAPVLGILLLRGHAAALGLRTTHADLDALLGGVRETAHFRIHHPREQNAHDLELLARDLEFRDAQDRVFLGTPEGDKVDAYFYRSPQEKQRWVGAAETDFAKPWLHEFHVQLAGFPDPVAKHELAHVLAAPFGSGPFRICAWGGLLPNPAIIEGLATAADDPVDELTLPEWAHAMRDLHLAPDLRTLLRADGFFAAPAARAYTITGAFLRHLAERFGREKLQRLYAHGDFDNVYGQSLDALVTEWEQSVDAVPLDAHARSVAARRFAAPSLFGKRCAREEARLREELGATPVAELPRAIALTERLLALSPEDAALLRDLARRELDAGQLDAAQRTLTALLGRTNLSVPQRADALALAAELDTRTGKLEQARQDDTALLALQGDGAGQRASEIRLAALAEPGARSDVLGYFRSPRREDALLRLRSLLDAHPHFAPARYLLGRRLTDAHLHTEALAYLEPTLTEALVALPRTAEESRRLRARDLAMLHRCDEAAAEIGSLPSPPLRAYFSDWVSRCRFEVAAALPVLPPPE
jgi:hypothetical protein